MIAMPRDITRPLRKVTSERKLRQLNVVTSKCADLDDFRAALAVRGW